MCVILFVPHIHDLKKFLRCRENVGVDSHGPSLPPVFFFSCSSLVLGCCCGSCILLGSCARAVAMRQGGGD